MEINNLQDWLIHTMQDSYSAEKMVLEALPKMEEAASHDDLKQAFKTHRAQTEEHIERLTQALDRFGKNPDDRVKCKGMEGLIEEGKDLLSKKDQIASDVFDAALIEAAQKVEHYEIAAYGSAATYADMLGEDEVARLLKETLSEEENTDEKLTMLAEGGINRAARSGK